MFSAYDAGNISTLQATLSTMEALASHYLEQIRSKILSNLEQNLKQNLDKIEQNLERKNQLQNKKNQPQNKKKEPQNKKKETRNKMPNKITEQKKTGSRTKSWNKIGLHTLS